MEDQVGTCAEAETGTVGEAAGTVQDLQRVALHDLVALAAKCAARETEIERHFAADTAANDEHLRKAMEDIDRRRRDLEGEFEQKYSELLAKIGIQYKADLHRLEKTQKTARQEIEREHTSAETGVKKKLAQAAWLAEPVLESTQNQLKEEAREAKQNFKNRHKALTELEEQAAGLMLAYGQEWAASAEEGESGAAATEPAEQSEQPENGPSFEAISEEAQQRLGELESLRLPRLTSGILPFVVVLLATAVAAGLAHLAAGTREPQFRLMGLAAGVTILVGTMVSVVLHRAAVGQV